MMNAGMISRLVTIWVLFLATAHGIETASIFANGMVLQQGMPVPVWGTGMPGGEVTVNFAGQEKSCKADRDGHWMIKLDSLTASAEPRTLTVRAADEKLDVTDVLVGEVWLASGQFNMNFWMLRSPLTSPHIDKGADPQLRLLQVPCALSGTPLTGFRAAWSKCNTNSLEYFSAVAYFFARDIRAATKVPVGIIQSTEGNTPAEGWASRETLESIPAFKGVFAAYEESVKKYDRERAKADYSEALKKYNEDLAKAKAEGKQSELPKAPSKPENPAYDKGRPCGLYNAMIAPLTPFAFRGVIWYQGESNAKNPDLYRTLFPVMIKDWRKAFGHEFPFIFVQVAPHKDLPPELRDAQLFTWRTVPNTAMTVITDHGSEKIIYPNNKEPVGVRLALAARALAYGEKIEYSGPLFDKLKVEGNQAILSFTHVGDGLEAKGDKLTGFEISGDGTAFVPAAATIAGDTVVVTSDEVKTPTAVRFGWANVPNGNLFNKNGLPATPFRADGK